MKHRHVFLTSGMAQAQRAVQGALESGTPDDDIHVVARSDIEIRSIHDRRKMADSDFIPAAMRGVVIGGIVGLLAAIAIVVAMGLNGWLVLFGLGAGAALGGFGASLMGAAVPDPVRRRFEKEIDSGNILIVVDAEEGAIDGAQAAMEGVGARRLPYDAPTAMS